MNHHFILTNAVILILLIDPFGNLPLFVSILQKYSAKDYRKTVLRESCFALVLMFLVLFAGRWMMGVLGLSSGILRLAGGLILIMTGTKMVFSSLIPDHAAAADMHKEPYIVPLAVPLICGPGTIAMLMTFLHSSKDATLGNVSASLLIAWAVQCIILMFGKVLSRLLGSKALDAMESLMGLLLVAMAVGMIVFGIKEIYGIPAEL